ncbi:MAG TPA: NAD-binding protein, partial [Candidatus Dormibacteraeota bacterium]|nr:NAD-binding protein [Candidatus Dormibacteraeota bacterium]
ATNTYIVLSARVLKPDLYIVARAADEAGVTKLGRAGANRAVSPYAIGGHRLAHLMLSPAVVDFFETALGRGSDALNIEDLAMPADSPSVGRRSTGSTSGGPPARRCWPFCATAARSRVHPGIWPWPRATICWRSAPEISSDASRS